MRKAKQEGKVTDEETEKRKPKGRRETTRCNPFKSSKDEKHTDVKYDIPLVDYEPDTNPDKTFVYDDSAMEASDTGVTSVSPRALKIFEAIREDEMELVLEELGNLTETHEIDKRDRHGFALIHVAARYNLNRIVNTLLDFGADINIGTSQYRWTPLHLAARCVENEMKSATVTFRALNFEHSICLSFATLAGFAYVLHTLQNKSKFLLFCCTLMTIEEGQLSFNFFYRRDAFCSTKKLFYFAINYPSLCFELFYL